jgi:hypothetical protein
MVIFGCSGALVLWLPASGGISAMKTFVIGKTKFLAENRFGNVLIDPELPENFGCTDNQKRSAEQLDKWWGRPYLELEIEDPEQWPDGVFYRVYCLDGGAWDRPTLWGRFESLHEALQCAEGGPARRKS